MEGTYRGHFIGIFENYEEANYKIQNFGHFATNPLAL